LTALTIALERREWSLASMYLLLAVSEAASRLPPESLEALLDLLAQTLPDERERPGAATRGGKR
jgi:hypothetical protein